MLTYFSYELFKICDNIIYIIDFIDNFEDIFNILLLNKYFYQYYIGKFLKLKNEFSCYINARYPMFIKNLFKSHPKVRC